MRSSTGTPGWIQTALLNKQLLQSTDGLSCTGFALFPLLNMTTSVRLLSKLPEDIGLHGVDMEPELYI